MTAPSNMNVVMAQGHMVFKLQNQRNKNVDRQQRLADEIELIERRRKKSQVETSEAENRIEAREDDAQTKERFPGKIGKNRSKRNDEKKARTDLESAGSHIDIKV